MFSILQHSHSGIRYISILLLIVLMYKSIKGIINSQSYTSGDKRIASLTSISLHIQLLIGFILYFMSPKVVFDSTTMSSDILRFFTMEHVLMMIIGIVLVTIAGVKARKQNNVASYKSLLIYGGIGFIIILAGIPWPFRAALGTGWF